MAELSLVTPTELFKSEVESALVNQHVSATDLTSFYLVNLLCAFARPQMPLQHPLSLRFQEAVESPHPMRRVHLRQLGDTALFLSGFFSDSLKRRLVDVDYYMVLGSYAYSSLASAEYAALANVFAELAEKFAAFVDVLTEVSERTALTSDADLLRLYEKWLRGSERSGRLLAEKGIVPNASVRTKFKH